MATNDDILNRLNFLVAEGNIEVTSPIDGEEELSLRQVASRTLEAVHHLAVNLKAVTDDLQAKVATIAEQVADIHAATVPSEPPTPV